MKRFCGRMISWPWWALVVGAATMAAADDPATVMVATMTQLEQQAESNAPAAEAVAVDAMRSFLPGPEAMSGFTRVRIVTESKAQLGVRVNTAMAEYGRTEGKGRIVVRLRDIVGLEAKAKKALLHHETDEEDGKRFRRAAHYKGFAGFEEYDRKTREGLVRLMAGERVAVEVAGSEVAFAVLRGVVVSLDLPGIAALQAVGAMDRAR